MGSIMWTSRIRRPSLSNSGFDRNAENVLQASELEQRNDGFDDLWKFMDVPELDEGKGCSICTGDPSTITQSEVQESERSLVMSKSESAVESELDLLSIPCISQISLVQSNHPNPTTLSASFVPDRLFPAVNKSQCMPVHSARMLNLMTIHTSLRKSHLEFSDGTERCALHDAYGYAEEANPSILLVSSKDLSDISIQHVPKRDFRCPMRIFKLKLVTASPYRFSMTIRVPQTIRIGSPSHLCSGFDFNVEDEWQVLELPLINEDSNDSWMVMSTPELDTGIECISWSFSTGVDSREHINRVPETVLAITIFRNSARRACSLFIYLVVWVPKDYIADTA